MGSVEPQELMPTEPLFNEIDILMGKIIKIEFSLYTSYVSWNSA